MRTQTKILQHFRLDANKLQKRDRTDIFEGLIIDFV